MKKQVVEKNKSIIEVNNITFSYENSNSKALDKVSLNITEGSYSCIVGHNGSGKSTLAKIIMGLLKPNSGKIKIKGLVMSPETIVEIRKNLGVVFQNPDNQFIGATVRDDIAFGLENRQVNPDMMDGIINRVSKVVGMNHLLDKEPQNLSGGQKQRVAVAGVLALESNIIIFDETTSMLDPRGKQEVKEIMVQLSKLPNKTIISITHDMEEVLSCDEVIVMRDSKFIGKYKPEVLFSQDHLIKENHLDLPFVYKLSKLINAKIPGIKPEFREAILVDEICQKHKLK